MFRKIAAWLVSGALLALAAPQVHSLGASRVESAYAANGQDLFWFRDGKLTEPARALLGEMAAPEPRGLAARDYGAAALLARLDAGDARGDPQALDRELSRAAEQFLADLQGGRVRPRDAGYEMDLPHPELDLAAALRTLAVSSNVARTLDLYEPQFHHFPLLKRSLAQYRELAARPGLNTLPPLPARSVKPGETYSGAPQLRTLLAAYGDLPATAAATPAAAADVLDPELVTALARFQQRHGLGADGVLGATTWRELTLPLQRRVRQIELSMERARWLPPPGDAPFIMVNIPQFRLFAFRGPDDREDLMMAMNVIVGKSFPEHNTPVFVADLRYVVLRPYWDVPAGIARKELLPKLRTPGYAAREGFELVRGQNDTSPVVPLDAQGLEGLERGTLRLRQRSGSNNALGLIKFMLPNRYNVYLHSTPAQSLFATTRRAYSHGCVRLENPLALAEFVFDGNPEWSRQRMEEVVKQPGGPVRMNLPVPMRVMIIYATAIAAEDGRTLFFSDIYEHDAKLEALLAAA